MGKRGNWKKYFESKEKTLTANSFELCAALFFLYMWSMSCKSVHMERGKQQVVYKKTSQEVTN